VGEARSASRSKVLLATVLKVGAILELYSMDQPEWGVSEIAREMNAPKSSVAALTSSMVSIGLLSRTGQHRYRLGWRFLVLSRTLVGSALFAQEWRGFIQPLAARLQDTIHLAALESGRVVYVDKLEGRDSVRIELTGVGAELPAHCTSLGKVLLSTLAWPQVSALVVQRGLTRYTSNTIIDPEELRRELSRVARQGYAWDLEEGMTGLCCVAAPIRDFAGDVVAAMSVSVVAGKFRPRQESYRRTVVQAARQFSERLGYFDRGRGAAPPQPA
jgi:DNA-binding IclR family transcriptional regulator